MKTLDLTSTKFGRLTALAAASTKRPTSWRCRCDCGTELVVLTNNLRMRRTQSCGCLQRERTSAACKTHGKRRTREYRIWANMKTRCFNPNVYCYRNYGARGITVCKRWLKFENFLADMGECPPGLTLERINNDRGYSKVNCRWDTYRAQRLNQRRMK